MYSCTLSLISALHGGVSPDHFTPRERDPLPIVQEAGWVPRLVRTGLPQPSSNNGPSNP